MGLLGSLFGGSKSKSESGNKFATDIKTAYTPWISSGGASMGAAANILGLNGAGAGEEALDNWWNSSGGQFMLEQGLDGVNNRFHSIGLGRSGAAMKSMEQFRSDLASTKLGEYLGFLQNQSQLGLGAGGLVADAGQYSKGSSSGSSGGLGKALGSVFSKLPLFGG